MDLQAISFNVASNLFFLFRWLGDIYLNLFGIFVIFAVLKHVIDTLVRIYHIYQIHGFGCWIWKAMWASWFAMWAIPEVIFKSAHRAVDRKLEEYRQQAMPPPGISELIQQHEEMKLAIDQLTMANSRIQSAGACETVRVPEHEWDSRPLDSFRRPGTYERGGRRHERGEEEDSYSDDGTSSNYRSARDNEGGNRFEAEVHSPLVPPRGQVPRAPPLPPRNGSQDHPDPGEEKGSRRE